jgi:hypothetical protein
MQVQFKKKKTTTTKKCRQTVVSFQLCIAEIRNKYTDQKVGRKPGPGKRVGKQAGNGEIKRRKNGE